MVYTAVNEVHSGSAELRKDLHIGEDGYPKYVLMGVDQQTCNLKTKYQDQYDWLYPVPGYW